MKYPTKAIWDAATWIFQAVPQRILTLPYLHRS